MSKLDSKTAQLVSFVAGLGAAAGVFPGTAHTVATKPRIYSEEKRDKARAMKREIAEWNANVDQRKAKRRTG